jgi:hypothetical protein
MGGHISLEMLLLLKYRTLTATHKPVKYLHNRQLVGPPARVQSKQPKAHIWRCLEGLAGRRLHGQPERAVVSKQSNRVRDARYFSERVTFESCKGQELK